MGTTLALACGLAGITFAQDEANTDDLKNKDAEYIAKADMIKNLIDMIQWPAKLTAQKKLTLCVIHDFPYQKQIASLNDKIASNMKINVQLIDDPLNTKTECQIILVDQRQADKAEKIIEYYKNKPVVLIGDMDRFALHGGSMNFVFLNKQLAITVNTDTMRESHLPIDIKSVQKITVIPQAEDLSR